MCMAGGRSHVVQQAPPADDMQRDRAHGGEDAIEWGEYRLGASVIVAVAAAKTDGRAVAMRSLADDRPVVSANQHPGAEGEAIVRGEVHEPMRARAVPRPCCAG
jgi:hypothetical protein